MDEAVTTRRGRPAFASAMAWNSTAVPASLTEM
jgi:hypothetical protein